ncbi:ABC transporter ATP-binding protein [Nostoc sp. FACHB-152]|nr:ABC transporter ATP-binding protein [Nostoc sp. FACHB-152]MBD2466908.1 ABC transporter ATP-binding protein [Nostoc sp. FACHB-145]
MTKFISKFLYLTKGSYRRLVAMICLFLFISALEVFGTGMVGPFIVTATNPDSVLNNYWLNLVYEHLGFSDKYKFLVFIGFVVTLIFYIKTFCAFSAQKEVFNFGYRLKGKLSYNLLKAYLEAPYSFHLRANSSTLIQNITTTTDNFCIGVVMAILTSVSNTIVILALLLLLVKTSTIALIFIGVLFLIIAGLLRLIKDRLARWGIQGWDASAEMIRILNHGLGGFKETRVIGCEGYFINQMDAQVRKYATNKVLADSYGNLPRFVIEAFMISFLIGFTLLFIEFNRGEEKNLTVVLGIFSLASIRLLPAVSNLLGNVSTVRANAFAIDKLFFDFKEIEDFKKIESREFYSSEHDSEKSSSLLKSRVDAEIISFKKEIYVDNVTFQYPQMSRKALDKISFSIQKGQSIGLIGKSGAGKTTLVDILLGLFIPQTGDIKVDGISIYSNIRAWQNMIGYVPQSIFLTDDTLEKNIAFGVPEDLIDQDRLKHSIEVAQLSEVVSQLSDGVKTVLGERGVLLSGGQRQRVGIARAIYHEREILVFDEATAALDNETEQLITEATKALARSKTIIIIAHRLSTIEHCDQIYQLEQGQILKSGSYREVILGQ